MWSLRYTSILRGKFHRRNGLLPSVPAAFALAKESFHRFVPGIEVFDCPGETMPRMRQTVGGTQARKSRQYPAVFVSFPERP